MSPQPPREPKIWPCLKCGVALANDDDTFDCEDSKCWETQLCPGCSYICDECESSYCRAHIVETPVGEFSAEYRCRACQEAHDAKKLAA